MKKNTMEGRYLKYCRCVLAAAGMVTVGWFLTYMHSGEEKISGFGLMLRLMEGHQNTGFTVLFLGASLSGVFMTALAAVNVIVPSLMKRRWLAAVSLTAVLFHTVLMFASKEMLDSSGIFEKGFLVKDFGAGYWMSLTASWISLCLAAKIAGIHPGHIILTVLSVIWLFPVIWILLTSVRGETGYYVGYFFPKKYTFDNYRNLFAANSEISFGKWWLNTLAVAAASCILAVLIILSTAYILSRTRFHGRTLLMKSIMIIGMFPGAMSMTAVYNILKGLGMAQTLTALVVVHAAGAVMGYYICKGFLDTIPKSLDEAAVMDGASRWQIFTRIMIPLSKPIIVYTALTSFLGQWSDYIFPSMVLGDNQENYTVALGLKWMTDFRRIDSYYTQFAAGAVVVAVPTVILFLVLQKFYVEEISGAVKG